MNNFIANLFSERKLLLRELKTLKMSDFSKKRNYELIYGINAKDYHTLVFVRFSKSKMLQAELENLDLIANCVASKLNIIINKRVLFYNSKICSKLNKQNNKWKFYDFM